MIRLLQIFLKAFVSKNRPENQGTNMFFFQNFNEILSAISWKYIKMHSPMFINFLNMFKYVSKYFPF